MTFFRVFLPGLMIASLVLGSSPLAPNDFDLLSLIPSVSRQKSCDVKALAQMFASYAQQAAAQLGDEDKSQVLAATNPYPDDWEAYQRFSGLVLPEVTEDAATEKYQVSITTRAEAFYVVGAKAVVQGNRLAALWCFCEAARRVPLAVTFLNNAAFALLEFGYYQDALKALECARSRAPEFISLYVNLGAAQEGLGQYAQASQNYQKAFDAFPTNGDYCRLTARAYHEAGLDEQAWIYAKQGQQNFPDLFDWDAFLASLNFSVPASPSPPWPVTGSRLYDELIGYIAIFMHDYETNTYNPAMSDLTKKYNNCTDTRNKCLNNCSVDACCSNKCFLQFYRDRFLLGLAQYEVEKQYWQVLMSRYDAKADEIKSEIIAENVNEVTAKQLIATIDAYRYMFLQNEINRLQKFSVQINQDNQLIVYHLECLEQTCNPVSLPGLADIFWMNWVFTAKITPGLEGTMCLALICVSVDAVTGDIGLQIGEGLVVKLTQNALTHDFGLNLGVGFQGGLGPANIEGTIYYKFRQNQVGLEPCFNFLGMGRLRFFMGFERL